ncbi:unnamed protein product [Acanthoscelides obtectus]|uniref:Uncharacterized protein n=1 Tax=Acanthoscelides obtectus TaxID=200917 RepID=A0A9P0K025_ACAOB|nr:unnamed protein product [Acanthoscelides obtectus]CAK1625284.1 La protein homolog [Acanthoscelides obtectus]
MINMASELEQKIIQQLEFYFGDINLPRDKFLQEKIKEDEGWVTIETLLTFKRLAGLSTDAEVIANAAEKSEDKLVVVSEDKKKIRRNPDKPVPEYDAERKKQLMERTAYAKGFPLDEDLNDIINFLVPHGPIDACNRRATKDHKFKGSCFIIFKDVETCKKFVEAESIKYKDTELIRKMQGDYFAEKKKEIEDKKKAKKEKKQAEEKPQKPLEFPKGAIIHFAGLQEGDSLTREELKDKVKEVADMETAFIDFKKGDLEGHIRFPEENNAVEFVKKLKDSELEIEKFKLKVRVLEGDEEVEYLKKTSDTVIELRKKQKQNSRQNRKRKGNFANQGGRDAKAKKKQEQE